MKYKVIVTKNAFWPPKVVYAIDLMQACTLQNFYEDKGYATKREYIGNA